MYAKASFKLVPNLDVTKQKLVQKQHHTVEPFLHTVLTHEMYATHGRLPSPSIVHGDPSIQRLHLFPTDWSGGVCFDYKF